MHLLHQCFTFTRRFRPPIRHFHFVHIWVAMETHSLWLPFSWCGWRCDAKMNVRLYPRLHSHITATMQHNAVDLFECIEHAQISPNGELRVRREQRKKGVAWPKKWNSACWCDDSKQNANTSVHCVWSAWAEFRARRLISSLNRIKLTRSVDKYPAIVLGLNVPCRRTYTIVTEMSARASPGVLPAEKMEEIFVYINRTLCRMWFELIWETTTVSLSPIRLWTFFEWIEWWQCVALRASTTTLTTPTACESKWVNVNGLSGKRLKIYSRIYQRIT